MVWNNKKDVKYSSIKYIKKNNFFLFIIKIALIYSLNKCDLNKTKRRLISYYKLFYANSKVLLNYSQLIDKHKRLIKLNYNASNSNNII